MSSGQTPPERRPDRPGESVTGTPEDGAPVSESDVEGSGSEHPTSPTQRKTRRTESPLTGEARGGRCER